MKKERNPILVVLCMILLLAVIAIPPTLRKLIPREEIPSQKEEKNSIAVLKCSKTFKEEQYEEMATTKYINGKISTNRILYQKIEELPEDKKENATNENQGDTTEIPSDTPNTIPEVTNPPTEESNNGVEQTPTTPDVETPENSESSVFKTVNEALAYFKSLNNINIKETDSKINILINKKSITDNADDMKLVNYFQDKLSDQQSYYESIGYTCNILES